MNSEILIYQNSDGNIKIDVRLEEETVWLTQTQMGQLFGKDKRTISEHTGNIFKEGELDEKVVVRKFRTTTQHGAIAGKTIEFFKVVQNKLLWAISQQTAAELVYRRADAALPLLGMQSYDKRNTVPIRKTDINIAKNYLNEDEIKLLGLLVEQYLAFAETMAQQQIPMYMKDWTERLDIILQLNGRE